MFKNAKENKKFISSKSLERNKSVERNKSRSRSKSPKIEKQCCQKNSNSNLCCIKTSSHNLQNYVLLGEKLDEIDLNNDCYGINNKNNNNKKSRHHCRHYRLKKGSENMHLKKEIEKITVYSICIFIILY